MVIAGADKERLKKKKKKKCAQTHTKWTVLEKGEI